ncbi:hypothetical protein [Sporosarcina trichiuri]|uniref:hypothetical protein n=1 Tax=Sporosarcina trichiuri TaxID=3056445 RepID=UPI0025B39AA9|nr:hypothetical protein [Sporosarcina sp. 0.2-SM1T-5]WJY28262.1 hypothetical protein QWT68_04560 [Sporosarcina sp. 0.2-SM1T-5]
MDLRIEKITEQISEMIGLQNCRLHNTSLFERPCAFGGTDIIVSCDWYPADTDVEEEDVNLPDGAVSVDYSLRFGQITLAVAAGGTSCAMPLTADSDKTAFFKKWAEQQTGLEFGQSLTLTAAGEDGYEAILTHGGFPLATESHMKIEWDADGRLLTAIMPLLASQVFEPAVFDLTLEDVEPLVREQLTLVRLPIEEEERFADYYAIDEVYITQDGHVLPYDTEDQGACFPAALLTWTGEEEISDVRHPVTPFRSNLAADEAFRILAEPSENLNSADLEEAARSAARFLGSAVSDGSGEWELYKVYRQPGIIEAECRMVGGINGPLRRKLKLLMDVHTYEVLNYMDSYEMARLFEGFTQPLVATVSQESAFDEMVPFITMDPVYVYHQETERYKLCGFLDSEECVDAVTGDLKNLNDV